MTGEEPQRAARPRLDDVVKEPRGPEAAAEPGEEALTCEMGRLVRFGAFSIPHLRAHPSRPDDLDDLIVAERFGAFEDGHAPVDHIEGQMLAAADFRPDDLVQDRDLFRTIQPVNAKTASGGWWRCCHLRGVFGRLAAASLCVFAIILMTVRMRVWTVVGHGKPLRISVEPKIGASVARGSRSFLGCSVLKAITISTVPPLNCSGATARRLDLTFHLREALFADPV